MYLTNKTYEELKTLLTEVKNELAARGFSNIDKYITLAHAIEYAKDHPNAKFESILYPIDQYFYPYTVKEGRLYEIYDDGSTHEVLDNYKNMDILKATFRIIME